MIQAINELYPSNSNIALVIVGGTWYSVDKITDYVAYIRTMAERASFPVITTGYVASELIHEWFWASDIFVCSSQWQEPLARVHYEAMSAGLPFLTTARGGNPEIVLGQSGLIVEQPEDPKEFAQKLKMLLVDPKLCQAMGENGRRLAEEHFGWERVAAEVLEVWNTKFNQTDRSSAENYVEINEENYLSQKERDLTEELISLVDNKTDDIDDFTAKETEIGKKKKKKKEKKLVLKGSSVVRISSEMFIPQKPSNNIINIIGSSVVKVTWDMMS